MPTRVRHPGAPQSRSGPTRQGEVSQAGVDGHLQARTLLSRRYERPAHQPRRYGSGRAAVARHSRPLATAPAYLQSPVAPPRTTALPRREAPSLRPQWRHWDGPGPAVSASEGRYRIRPEAVTSRPLGACSLFVHLDHVVAGGATHANRRWPVTMAPSAAARCGERARCLANGRQARRPGKQVWKVRMIVIVVACPERSTRRTIRTR